MKTLLAVVVIVSGLLFPSAVAAEDINRGFESTVGSVYENALVHGGYRYHRHYRYGLHYRGDHYRYRPYRYGVRYYRYSGGRYCR